MNMKQKLTYMLIGCLFTLAGTVISDLTNTPTQAQDDKVIDEIVCKKLKVVNDVGMTVAELSNEIGGPNLKLQNPFGEDSIELNLFFGLKIKNDQGKTTVELGNNVLTECGFLKIFDKEGRLATELESERIGGGQLTIYTCIKKGSMYLNGLGMYIDNEDAKTVAALETAGLSIYNDDGMKFEKDGENIVVKNKLVTIGAVRGRPNDGLINIYNHKGEWRSYKGD